MAGILGTYFTGHNTPEDYTKAYQQSNKALQGMGNTIQNQKALNSQYTGNAGYQNSLQQGLQGANVLSGQAGNQALQAARNTGMTKAQAAAMGTGAASNAFGNNFTNQQSMAANQGMNAINANMGLANQQAQLSNQYNQNATMAQNEAQRKTGNAANELQTGINAAGALGKFLTGLSDERMKDVHDNVDHISKLAEDIGTYLYTYKPEAQEAYPDETDDKTRIGVTAQDLEKNPVTNGAVMEDKNGIKHVNGAQLAMEAIALISDMSKRISEIEKGE